MNPCYAIIPAAGSSRRMGQPKLLLPWPKAELPTTFGAQRPGLSTQYSVPCDQTSLGGALSTRTVIDQVLQAWTRSRVTETIIVIRSDDLALREACRRWPVTVVHPPAATQDMKASLCVGLQDLIDRKLPTLGARCFIAPADLPHLSTTVIDGLIDAQPDGHFVCVPRFGKTLDSSITGHPVLLPWAWTSEIFSLGPHEGVDAIIKRHFQKYVLFPPELAVMDIDTPDDYQSAIDRAMRRP